MNILYINHYAGGRRYGMEFRPYYLAKEWNSRGHRVMVVGASYSHLRMVQPVMEGRLLEETDEGIEYKWYRTPHYQGNGVGRVINILHFLRAVFSDARSIAKSFRPDVVIASSTYPMDIWPAHRIAKLAGAKLIFEVHDLWPMTPIELGGMSKWHPVMMWMQMAEDFAYAKADTVVSMLPCTKQHMIGRGMREDKFHYIPNGMAIAEWQRSSALPVDVRDVFEAVIGRGKPIVGYSGFHGLANALDSLLKAAEKLGDRVEIVMVGKGPEKQRLLEIVRERRLTNVTMLPPIPKPSIPAFLSRVDIAFIGWNENPMYRYGISPNKLMDYMMAGCPVVHAVTAGNDPVAEAGCGITVKANDVEGIVRAVDALLEMPEERRREMGARGRQYVLETRDYKILAEHFMRVMEDPYARD